ncbi:50S ribosomal protein L31 [Candidatus Gottesmanbacteria bacterium RBG_16_52_11]|uniref:Large ribosomal subunit protein bL31 n=1 Tax=Candidatus Gottesmanbacteria bacterium RBG_16_52_11 TaxID=1798374 RepID=A0A1F5YNV7_9BACT|nr:MAG: 50S ribosomal protein L31 [Candidatus Gottesmanbacteria bacterium RBG_16_52_11]
MKAAIHPQWFDKAVVSCACGNTFTVGATKPEIKTDICSNCHPFYTGEMKFVDALGRVERFQQKQKQAREQASQLAAKKKKKQERQEQLRSQKSLKDMLTAIK